MSSETRNILERAKRQLRRVDTVDETKQHGYLGRVIGETTEPSASSRTMKSQGLEDRLPPEIRNLGREKPAASSIIEEKKLCEGQRFDGTPIEGRRLSLDNAGSMKESSKGIPSKEGMMESSKGIPSKEGMKDMSSKQESIKDTPTGLLGTPKSSTTEEQDIKDKEFMSTSDKDVLGTSSASTGVPETEMSGDEYEAFDLCYVGEIDIPEQLRILDEDIEKLNRKLQLSEDRIRKHQIRKEQNLSIQRDAGIKAAELKSIALEKEELKKKALERERELESQRAEAHREAIKYEIERARLRASELATLEIQKISLQRIRNHERGIKFGQAMKRRLEIQMNILKAQKELLMFEDKMRDVLNDRPPLHHQSVNILHEVPIERIDEFRIFDEPVNEKGIASGVFEEEFTSLGDSDVPLKDTSFKINTIE